MQRNHGLVSHKSYQTSEFGVSTAYYQETVAALDSFSVKRVSTEHLTV